MYWEAQQNMFSDMEGIQTMQAASIIVRRQRGVLVVQATGRTGRGQAFIKATIPLTVTSMGDPKFKAELGAAVFQLLVSEA